jgi:hypothetical protein
MRKQEAAYLASGRRIFVDRRWHPPAALVLAVFFAGGVVLAAVVHLIARW